MSLGTSLYEAAIRRGLLIFAAGLAAPVAVPAVLATGPVALATNVVRQVPATTVSRAAASSPSRAVPAPPAAPAPAPTPALAGAVGSAQELSFDGLGLGTQTLYGRANTVVAYFPAPAGTLASNGSALRLVVAHSALLDPLTSALHVLVNGQERTVLALDASNVDGAVQEVALSTAALHADQPNLVELRFDARLAGRTNDQGADPGVFVRLDGQTLLRYQLYAPAGAPPPARLDAFPFPLTGGHGTAPARLGLVLPSSPTGPDLTTAFRIAADLGRLSVGQQVAPEVVSAGQLDWLRSGGIPALVVGTIDRLSSADPLLRAAGFTPTQSGWKAPDGRQAGRDTGVVAAITSPWDRRTPLILVTGATDAAVSRAAGALSQPGRIPPASVFVLVNPDQQWPAPAPVPEPNGIVTFPALGDQGLLAQGPGHHRAGLPFLAPAVDGSGTASLQLTVGHTPVPAGSLSSLTALINGTAVGGVALNTGNERATDVRIQLPGSLLRPGRNLLALDISLPAMDTASVRVASDLRLVLPGSPSTLSRLEALPHPLFDGGAATRLVLGAGDDASLSAAARVITALGSRALSTPALTADYASRTSSAALAGAHLLVVGVSSRSAEAGTIARAAGVSSINPLPATRPGQDLSSIQTLTGGAGHEVVWLEGTNPAAVAVTADALYRAPLAGEAVSIDATGEVRSLSVAAGQATSITLVKVLIAASALGLVLAVAWQAWRPKSEEN
jgi:hypothetical protein